MRALKSILIMAAALAFGASVFAERNKSQNTSSGARARHPSVSGGGSSSSSSSKRSSTSSERVSSGSSSQSTSSAGRFSRGASRSSAASRHPEPWKWRRHEPVRVVNYWPYRTHYRSHSYYPYWGYYDGYYYGYYGWRAPYWRPRVVYHYDRDFGSLRLMVQPEHAEVFVDGYFAGIVDDFNGMLQRLHLQPGRHEIMLKADGYQTHRIKVFVPIDHTVKIRYDMKPGRSEELTETTVGSEEDVETASEDDALDAEYGPGLLKLSVTPDDASIYIDGEHQGSARDVNEVELPAGVHLVEVVRPGFATYEREVDVPVDETAMLDVKLESLQGADLP
ncbi:MAG: PEGA domain-containing protein [Vicinamibacteria bacterium]|nr:PEGA domain-containing protein [Vicinamibacteria bacterium]